MPPRAAPHAQPQLREEDQCPVCHKALPPKGIDGSETVREAHVAACIETSLSSAVPNTLQLATRAWAEAAVTANENTAGQTGSGSAILEGSRGAWQTPGRGDGAFESIGNSRQRVRGMVVYQATEKDCVGEDGAGQAECVICFEEFEAGVDMGRLECLCKFHKVCITLTC